MRVVVTGRHVEVTPQLRKLVDQRLAKVDRLLNDGIVSAQVVLTLERYRHVVEITVHARGDRMLHGLGDTRAWETSLAGAVEKLMGQVQKVKGKWERRKRKAVSQRALPPPVAPPPAPVEEPRPKRVVRTARYPIKPMTVEEAALSVDEGQDAFLVFRNASSDAINVLYRRKDGHLGLIEPES
jgi:ribosome hibernation promoting factor